MNGLTFVPKHNTPGKKDVTGAFLPKALEFTRKHGGAVVRFDNELPLAKRARTILDALGAAKDLDYVAFFCHGWAGGHSGIQAGFRVQNAPILARAIAVAAKENVRVCTYCCELASDADFDEDDDNVSGPAGDGGFCDIIRDELAKAGLVHARAIGHTTTAHTTANPFVRVFDADGTRNPHSGGVWMIPPHDRSWRRWKSALKSTDLWARIPFLTRAEVEAELWRWR